MSIFIKGMNMPENCDECQLCYDYLECMAASNNVRLNFETRPKECPLVEVKEPHGRLIDADKLKGELIKEKTRMAELAHISKDFKYMAQAFGLNMARILTTIQQTIIEAEGDKENE